MSSPSIKVIQITDTHLFEDKATTLLGLRTYECAAACVAQVQHRHPDCAAILATGDLVQEASAQAYLHLQELFAPLSCPIYCVSGNHDDPDLLAQACTIPGWSYAGIHRHGNWQIAMLDSHVSGSEGGILDEAQHLNLRERLQANPDHHFLLAIHHPPASCGNRWMDEMLLSNGSRLLADVEQHANAKLMVCGHVHQDYRLPDTDLPVYATPSTCVQFKPHSEQFAVEASAPGYRVIEMYEDGKFRTRVERLPEPIGELDLESRGY